MTFTVINTNDSGAGSLRQAILDSDNNPPPQNMTNLIQFNIPGSGVHTITLTSPQALEIDQPVIIDGYTQPGASANTLAIGDNAVLLIRIDGGTTSPIFFLCDPIGCGGSGYSSDNSMIKGLCIVQQSGGGPMLAIRSNNDFVIGNFLGVDTDGVTLGGFSTPLDISMNVSGTTIGGTSPAARNVMAISIGQTLLQIDGGNTLVQGNYLGVNAAGTAALGLADNGVVVELGSGTTVGGSASGTRNVINARVRGVQVGAGPPISNTTVQGNLIGTDATGTVAFHTLDTGIVLATSSNTTIGGSAPDAGNVVSGSGSQGIVIIPGSSPTGMVIQGNKIGTDITGTMPLGNGGCGILLFSFSGGGMIGGTNSGEGNIIAFNGANGVSISSATTGWAILGNSIHDNTGLGITFTGSCSGIPMPTLNDHCDTDTGANDLQNYPVITSASFSGGNVTLSGTLDSVPNTGFRLEFFSNTEGDPSGFGEGQTFLGSTIVTTDGNCSASFGPLSFPVPSGQLLVTATATILDAGGNPIETSEFSAFFPGPPPPMATGAVSRKTHGSAGTFDIDLPLTGNIGIECRSGGAANNYQMIISFANSVTVESASVTSGTGSVSSFSVSGSQVTVDLTGVTNVQRITVTLHNVNDGMHSGDVPLSMGVLVGDVNGNAIVNASDVSLTKSQVGQPVSSSNFREDVNANGLINSVDVAQVKANVGTALPP